MALRDRFRATLSRADQILTERLNREEAELERQDAAERAEARTQARADGERRQEIAARYDPAFSAFNGLTPQPADDEAPGAYRRRLYNRLLRRLPDGHELQGVRADDLGFSANAFANFERMLIDAARQEGERPSYENVPPSGELVQLIRTDEGTGERSVTWYGRSRSSNRVSGRSAGIALHRPANPVSVDGTAVRRCPSIGGLTMADARHHHAVPSVIFVLPEAGSSKSTRSVKPGNYPRQDRTPWNPQRVIPTKGSKGAATLELMRRIAEQDRIARSIMRPDMAMLKAIYGIGGQRAG